MNPILRMDAAIARFAVRFFDSKGVKLQSGMPLSMEDFMPWPKQEEAVATPEQVLAFLTSKVKKDK